MFLLLACSDYDLQAKPAEEADPVDSGGETLPVVTDTEEPQDTDTGTITTAPDEDRPVAICEVSPNPVEPPFEAATWIGTGSYDPQGDAIVDYDWTLISAPAGSTAVMPGGTGATRSGFTPDLAGDYTAILVVGTADGRSSDPCEVTLQAVPGEAIWVELFWSHANDDMDLHLLRPGGSLVSNGDCYYANCVPIWTFTLDWGDSSDSTDNPRLDLDDIPGTGPENINLDNPWSGYTGVYSVVVHDYALSGQTYNGDNEVTVRVYLSGLLMYEDTKTISGEDSYTYFAEIDATASTVTAL